MLCYHSIHPSLPFASASPALFRAQLDWLTTNCDVVRLADVGALARDETRSRPAVALTFDDGYRDNHEHALPALDEFGAHATFFVTVGLVERDPQVIARLARIRGTPPEDVTAVTWPEARELVAAGQEIGSHTWSHPVLADLDTASAREELERSKAVLEDQLQIPVTSLGYPFGKPGRHFTRETESLVRKAGYARAAAVLFRPVRERDSDLAIPRFFATQDDVETLAAKVLGRWDWLGAWQERAPGWLARRVSPADYRDPDPGEPVLGSTREDPRICTAAISRARSPGRTESCTRRRSSCAKAGTRWRSSHLRPPTCDRIPSPVDATSTGVAETVASACSGRTESTSSTATISIRRSARASSRLPRKRERRSS